MRISDWSSDVCSSDLERVAQTYARELAPYLDVPAVPEGCNSVWAQYTVKARPGQSRDDIMAELMNQGVPTADYYPRPLHPQTAYTAFPTDPPGLPIPEALATSVFSLYRKRVVWGKVGYERVAL